MIEQRGSMAKGPQFLQGANEVHLGYPYEFSVRDPHSGEYVRADVYPLGDEGTTETHEHIAIYDGSKPRSPRVATATFDVKQHHTPTPDSFNDTADIEVIVLTESGTGYHAHFPNLAPGETGTLKEQGKNKLGLGLTTHHLLPEPDRG